MAKSETWQTIAIIDGGVPPLSGTPTLRIYPVNSIVARQDNAPPPGPTARPDTGPPPPPPPTETSRRLVIPAGASPTLAAPALYNNITVLNGTSQIDKLISAVDHNQTALISGLVAVAVIFALFSCCCCIYCGREHKKKMDAKKKKNMQLTKKGNFTNTGGASMRQTGGHGNGNVGSNGGSRREGGGTDQGLAHRAV